MAFKQQQLTVSANGTYDFGSSPTESYSYKVDGSFGSGTIEVGYINFGGAFVRYDAIAASTAASQGVITCGDGSSVAFKLAGATAPVIYVSVNPA